MAVTGLHHITLVTNDAQRNVEFYAGYLGLRLVKKTVNFDDPASYHLYYGDETGRPGSAVTFFEWSQAAPGKPGIGGTHHYALTVSEYDGLLKWKRRLTDLGLQVVGPYDRRYFISIYFRDPDGTIVEIATRGPGFLVDEEKTALGKAHQEPPWELMAGSRDEDAIAGKTWPEPVSKITADMALSRGMHHITAISSDNSRTNAFYAELLDLPVVKMTTDFDDATSSHWYWGLDDGQPGTLITYFERRPGDGVRSYARMGAGQTHHFALAVPDEETQLAYRQRLLKAGLRVSPVMDRIYFKSIYTNDPDGHIVEIATAGPGFLVDEEEAGLGQALCLPPWLESHRTTIETNLKPISAPDWPQPTGQA